MVGALAERNAELDGEHHALAPSAGQRLADDQLRLAGGVAIGGVGEIDPRVQPLVGDPERLLVIAGAEAAEHHRAPAQLSGPRPPAAHSPAARWRLPLLP